MLADVLANNALILGAGGAMGQAMLSHFLQDSQIDGVFAVSRSASKLSDPKLQWIKTDYNESSMAEVVEGLINYRGTFSRVCICHGVLHGEQFFPEKRMEEISANSLHELFHANTVVPAIWLKLLARILVGSRPCKLACFSARVGSTGDNRLGGWYSYRASKAALNSLLKTYAIEYARRAKNIKLLAFHPGTVDSAMSKPFQSSVPEGKLFKASYVATHLAEIMQQLPCDGEISYLDYAGKPIPW
jgi:NAD(P)-dependent dehydrogenase (short-subunit alcohol dehydrogenase family)